MVKDYSIVMTNVKMVVREPIKWDDETISKLSKVIVKDFSKPERE